MHKNPEEMAQLVVDAAGHFSRAEAYVDLTAVLRELADNDAYKGDYLNVTMDLLYVEMPYEEAAHALRDVADFGAGIDWS